MRHIGCTEKLQKCGDEVKRFEQELQQRHQEQMKEEMRQYLEGLDRKASQNVLERGGYESRGLKKRTILTSFGEITLRVRCYENRRGHRIYPLGDLCGIGTETVRARERCVRLAVERPYGWSAELLGDEFGMELSRMRLWKIIQQQGQQAQQQLEVERAKIYEQAQAGKGGRPSKVIATMELDGTMIASREAAERDRYGRKRMEVKVGVLFRGTQRLGRRRRRKTLQRSVYARINDVEAFGEQWYTHCRRAGLGNEEGVHCIGDGGGWISTVRQGHFPGSDYTLDLYHLKKRAREVLLEHQSERFLALVRTGLVSTAIDYLEDLRPSDSHHREALSDFRQYVEQNRDGLRYEPGAIWGSGVVEKMVDVVVGKRMKRQGMSWSKQGANNLLALRCRHINSVAAQAPQ